MESGAEMPDDGVLGRIASLWRYPVKSMMGEDLPEAEVNPGGLTGDRLHALADRGDGSIGSAKRWPRLFEFRARLAGDAVRITLPGGQVITSAQEDCASILSRALEREVELQSASAAFHDLAVIHLLTTATLERLGALAPGSRFDPRRFRPNIVVETGPDQEGFIENGWIGQTLAIGDVRLGVTGPCERCVMTTLPQDDLPGDPEILRTAARHNNAHVGVYAEVLRAGTIRRGDPVSLAGP